MGISMSLSRGVKQFLQLPLFVYITISTGYALDDVSEIDRQQYNQYQQRLDTLENEENRPFVQLNNPSSSIDLQELPIGENPCFNITEVHIETLDNETSVNKFIHMLDPIVKGKTSVINKCIGQQGLNFALHTVQNELIKEGFITTQATLLSQDLTTGKLVFTIIPGKVGEIWRTEDSNPNVNPSNALTLSKGDILNLREIETSLENFRLPQSAQTNIDIIPSIKPLDSESHGNSDIVINQHRTHPIHWQLSIDDAGSKDIGKYQGTISASLDNPLRSNDVLSLSYTHTIDPWSNTERPADNHSLYVNYRYPYKKSLLEITHSDYDFNQTLAGLNQDIIYSGKSTQSSVGIQRLLHRDEKSKTLAKLSGYHKNSKNYFDDQEIEVQRRRTSGWKLAVDHQRQTFLGDVNARLEYEKGTGALSAIEAPESYITDAKSQPTIWSADLNLNHPFYIASSPYQYNMHWRGQYSHQTLIPQDRFSIGGRYTLKGLSDEQSLSGESGILLQQEVAKIMSLDNNITLMPYVTLDQGWVDGPSTQYLAGRYLMSTSLGARIYSQNISIDGFVGRGLQAPRSIDKDASAGFKITLYN